MATQDQINADVQSIGDALNSIADEITNLKAQIAQQVPESVDLSGLDAIAQKAQSLVPAVTQAATTDATTPTTDSSTPAVDPVQDPNADVTVPGTNPPPTV